MTDEEKKVEETKVCKCGELGRFFTLVAAIFLGVLLAILVSAALLRPKCPCQKFMHMPMGGPGIERQMPPFGPQGVARPMPPMGGHWQVKHHGFGKKFDGHRHDFRQNVNPDKAPVKK